MGGGTKYVEIQGSFTSEGGPPDYTGFKLRPDAPEIVIAFRPGMRFRVYVDDEGFASGIVTVHETADEQGRRRIHDDDYSFSLPSEHGDFSQNLPPG